MNVSDQAKRAGEKISSKGKELLQSMQRETPIFTPLIKKKKF
jgi:hypothetical protein